jgi:hypothetical protein
MPYLQLEWGRHRQSALNTVFMLSLKTKDLVASFRNFSHPAAAALFPSDTAANGSYEKPNEGKAQEPEATLSSPFLRCTISAMKKYLPPSLAVDHLKH